MAAIRAAKATDGEGALRVAFLDAHDRLLATTRIEEGTRHVDELFLRHLSDEVGRMGAPRVLVIVTRESGRPTRVDRLIFRELTSRLSGSVTSVADLVVVGSAAWWSARAGGRVGSVDGARAQPLDRSVPRR